VHDDSGSLMRMDEKWRGRTGSLIAISLGVFAATASDIIPGATYEYVVPLVVFLLGVSFVLRYRPPKRAVLAMSLSCIVVIVISLTPWYQRLPLWLLASSVVVAWIFLFLMIKRSPR
jgi:hypothetical protein